MKRVFPILITFLSISTSLTPSYAANNFSAARPCENLRGHRIVGDEGCEYPYEETVRCNEKATGDPGNDRQALWCVEHEEVK